MDSDSEKNDGLSERIQKAEAKSSGAAKQPHLITATGSRVGLDFAGGIFGGGILGALLDYSFHTTPWCMIAMIIVGFGVGMKSAWRAMQQDNK